MAPRSLISTQVWSRVNNCLADAGPMLVDRPKFDPNLFGIKFKLGRILPMLVDTGPTVSNMVQIGRARSKFGRHPTNGQGSAACVRHCAASNWRSSSYPSSSRYRPMASATSFALSQHGYRRPRSDGQEQLQVSSEDGPTMRKGTRLLRASPWARARGACAAAPGRGPSSTRRSRTSSQRGPCIGNRSGNRTLASGGRLPESAGRWARRHIGRSLPLPVPTVGRPIGKPVGRPGGRLKGNGWWLPEPGLAPIPPPATSTSHFLAVMPSVMLRWSIIVPESSSLRRPKRPRMLSGAPGPGLPDLGPTLAEAAPIHTGPPRCGDCRVTSCLEVAPSSVDILPNSINIAPRVANVVQYIQAKCRRALRRCHPDIGRDRATPGPKQRKVARTRQLVITSRQEKRPESSM